MAQGYDDGRRKAGEKGIAMAALSLKGKVKWRENLERCLADFGWGNVRLDSVNGMSNTVVKYMLKNCVCRQVTTLWVEELEEQPNLCVLKELVRGEFEARYVGVRRKKIRRILMKRRGCSRAAGGGRRWTGLKTEARKSTECDSGEMEDVKHFLMKCKTWNGERKELKEKMKKVVTGFDEV